jgi:hypothetical protein
LVIKAVQEAEIKRNVDNALAIKKQQMTSDHENVKRQLIVEHNKLNQVIKTELESLKKSFQTTCRQYNDLNHKYQTNMANGTNSRICLNCNSSSNGCYTASSSMTTCGISGRSVHINNFTGKYI